VHEIPIEVIRTAAQTRKPLGNAVRSWPARCIEAGAGDHAGLRCTGQRMQNEGAGVGTMRDMPARADGSRHYLVRRTERVRRASRDTVWAICCEGQELTSLAERERAIDLASKVARADYEEFGTETDVLIEEDGGTVRRYACFGAKAKLC
jgi:hypothetical protein